LSDSVNHATTAATARNELFFLSSAHQRQFARRGLFTEQELLSVIKFFRAQPEYSPTALRSLPHLARELNISKLLIKDESSRLGLNAFKVLGVTYAVHRMLSTGELSSDAVLACATDGNHGRAVAHVARQLKLRAKVYLPTGSSKARAGAIESEGAEVTIVDGNYDATVTQLACDAEMHGWTVISDTAWDGYNTVPRYIMLGYTMIMAEAVEQWDEVPDVVIVQAGVGGLAASVVAWFVHTFGQDRPLLVCCEAVNAACVLESMRANAPVIVGGSLETVMAGLSAGTVSSISWPVLRDGLDACVAITDPESLAAVRKLAHPEGGDPQIVAGESGAAGVAALSAIMYRKGLAPVRQALKLGQRSRVLVINTEGATDPESYLSITGLLKN
jgi:diaminopropionate ammonia-lyase